MDEKKMLVLLDAARENLTPLVASSLRKGAMDRFMEIGAPNFRDPVGVKTYLDGIERIPGADSKGVPFRRGHKYIILGSILAKANGTSIRDRLSEAISKGGYSDGLLKMLQKVSSEDCLVACQMVCLALGVEVMVKIASPKYTAALQFFGRREAGGYYLVPVNQSMVADSKGAIIMPPVASGGNSGSGGSSTTTTTTTTTASKP